MVDAIEMCRIAKSAIEAAFPARPNLGRTGGPLCLDLIECFEAFEGKDWRNLSHETLFTSRECWIFLPKKWAMAYLPAYLWLALELCHDQLAVYPWEVWPGNIDRLLPPPLWGGGNSVGHPFNCQQCHAISLFFHALAAAGLDPFHTGDLPEATAFWAGESSRLRGGGDPDSQPP